MASAGTISVGSELRLGNLSKGLQQGKTEIASFASSIVGNITKGINAFSALGLASVGLSALYNAVKGLVTAPLEAAASAERASVRFKILTGSVGEASKILKSLKEFGRNEATMFSGDEIKNAAASLIAVGVNADKVVPTLRKLGDISSGLNIGLDEMVSIYEKVRQHGSLTERELTGMAKHGIDLTGILAKQFGTTAENVKALGKAGVITFDHFDTALTNLTSKNSTFGGMMKETASGLGGSWSALMNKMGERTTQFGKTLSETFHLTEAIQWFSDAMDTVNDYSSKAFGYVKDVVKSVIPVFEAWFGYVKAGFQMWADIIEQGINFISDHITINFGKIKDDVVYAFNFMEYAALNWKDSLKIVWTAALLGGVSFVNATIHMFTSDLPEATKWFFRNFTGIMNNLWEGTKAIFVNLCSNIVDLICAIPDLITGKKSLGDVWKPLFEGARFQVVETLKLIPRVAGEYESQLTNELRVMNTKWKEGFDGFLKTKEDVSKKLKEGLGIGSSIKSDIVNGAVGGLATVKKQADIIKSELPSISNKLKDSLSDVQVRGSKEARETILRHMFSSQGNDSAKQTAKNTATTAQGVTSLVPIMGAVAEQLKNIKSKSF